MNKHEYISQLKKLLRKLPYDEVKEAVDYYEQYFDDAGEDNEQAVISELGPPSAVASQIIASFAVKGTGQPAKKSLSTAWMSILAVFASPIALPLALVVVVLAFTLVIVLASVIFSFGATGVGLVLGGIVCIVSSILIISQSIPTAIFFIGAGLTVSGLGAAIIIGTIKLSRISFNAIARNMGRFILRRNRK